MVVEKAASREHKLKAPRHWSLLINNDVGKGSAGKVDATETDVLTMCYAENTI
jgi:hypothetical protein